jgi:hypothetical protein
MERLGEKYRYGHFVHNARRLLWAAAREVVSKENDVPCWSWASIEGTVQFMGIRSANPNYHNRSLHTQSSTSTIDASILSTNDIGLREMCELVVYAQIKTLVMCGSAKGQFPSWWRIWAGVSPVGVCLGESIRNSVLRPLSRRKRRS